MGARAFALNGYGGREDYGAMIADPSVPFASNWIYSVTSKSSGGVIRSFVFYQDAANPAVYGEWQLPVALAGSQSAALFTALQKYNGQAPALVKAALDGGAFDSFWANPFSAVPSLTAPVLLPASFGASQYRLYGELLEEGLAPVKEDDPMRILVTHSGEPITRASDAFDSTPSVVVGSPDPAIGSGGPAPEPMFAGAMGFLSTPAGKLIAVVGGVWLLARLFR